MDRRAISREYKETPRPMGVYRVLNRVNGRALVGASIDVPSMLNRQRAQLNMGSHPDKVMQQDWNDAGADAFTFEVLDTLEPGEKDRNPRKELEVLLEMWLQKLYPGADPGYATRARRA